jgi:hypothetical protein
MVPKNQIGTIRNVPEEALRLRIIGRLAIRLRTMTGERSALSRGCATVRKSENEGGGFEKQNPGFGVLGNVLVLGGR